MIRDIRVIFATANSVEALWPRDSTRTATERRGYTRRRTGFAVVAGVSPARIKGTAAPNAFGAASTEDSFNHEWIEGTRGSRVGEGAAFTSFQILKVRLRETR
jgi:hypothetical protein